MLVCSSSDFFYSLFSFASLSGFPLLHSSSQSQSFFLFMAGRDFLFVFGGKNQSESVLGDSSFLSLDQRHWTEIPVEGAAPAARHSHSACSYQGGVVVFGGLSREGVPLGDTSLLMPTERGFHWERIAVQPPPVP
ncbi:hypothetical protein XENOCAPTIV_025001, partial [Xenoophorus captivus]